MARESSAMLGWINLASADLLPIGPQGNVFTPLLITTTMNKSA